MRDCRGSDLQSFARNPELEIGSKDIKSQNALFRCILFAKGATMLNLSGKSGILSSPLR